MSNQLDTSFGEDAINFDLNKNTILSNFEEWIKLSTDNKITSKNSWQFALIDYFHDLNVIKDGDDINFQRASATLDGCVKIYLSRVESVATETGKLLSGLANKKQEDGEDIELEDEEEVDPGKKARKINRVMESTLVKFNTIKIKKLDQELAIDPLFKKALAEFDEGGAKSLLLNTLNIDKTGRVVFDATTTGKQVDEKDYTPESSQMSQTPINLGKVQNLLFKDNDTLDDLTICPSIEQLKVVLNDINAAKTILGDVNNKYMNQPEIEVDKNFDFGHYENGEEDFGGDDFGDDFGGDGEGDGEVGEFNDFGGDFENNDFGEDGEERDVLTHEDGYELRPSTQILDQDLMAYFDETMKSNWRGPEHWKVSMYKKFKNLKDNGADAGASAATTTSAGVKEKKKKDTLIIDFSEELDEDYEQDLFENQKAALLRKKDNEEPTKLPVDIQYSSNKLITLFLKPSTIMHYTKVPKSYTDETFFADQYNTQDRMTSFHQAQMDEINEFDGGEDDVFGGIDFNDALEDNATPGDNLLIGGRKVRPEYVNFSRIAKRVDIKLLKDNLWQGIQNITPPSSPKDSQPEKKETKSFGKVVESIGKMYNPEERKDLSTSFCFICLLHLANEHSLDIESTEAHDDLKITGF